MAAGRPAARPKPASRGRRQPAEDPFVAPNKAQDRRFKAQARGQEDVLKRTYEAGRKEGAAAARGKSAPRSRPGASRSRRSAPGAKTARKVARELQAPVRAQFTSGLRLIGLALAVTALYAILSNAAAFGGVLGGIGKAFDWLGSTRGVPHKP